MRLQEVCSGATVCGPTLKTRFRTATRIYIRKNIGEISIIFIIIVHAQKSYFFSENHFLTFFGARQFVNTLSQFHEVRNVRLGIRKL